VKQCVCYEDPPSVLFGCAVNCRSCEVQWFFRMLSMPCGSGWPRPVAFYVRDVALYIRWCEIGYRGLDVFALGRLPPYFVSLFPPSTNWSRLAFGHFSRHFMWLIVVIELRSVAYCSARLDGLFLAR